MRKMTKLGIDELRKEFPVMTVFMQSKTRGGANNTCAIEAVLYASNYLGVYVSNDLVWANAVDIVMQRPAVNDVSSAVAWIKRYGLSDSEAEQLWVRSFPECESGAQGAPFCVTMVAYTVRDNNGNVVKENGVDVTHAGIIIGYQDNGKAIVRSSLGEVDVDPNDFRTQYSVMSNDPNCGVVDECGGGYEGGGGNGGEESGSGSGL